MRVSRNVASTCEQSRHKSSPHIDSRLEEMKTKHNTTNFPSSSDINRTVLLNRPIRGQLDEQREIVSSETRDTPVRVKLSAKVRAQSFSSFSCFSCAHAAQSRDGPRESAQTVRYYSQENRKIPVFTLVSTSDNKIILLTKMMRFGDIF